VDPLLALQALGYRISDPSAALQAFRRHFLGEDSSAPLSGQELDVLYCLVEQKALASEPQ
jgi:hypothetical protein